VNTTKIERFLCLVGRRKCMYEEVLREVGLSLNEARVYEAMLQLEEVNVHAISVKSKVHRRNVYDALSKLMDKGLVAEFIIKGEKQFKATNPDRLLTIVREKEGRVEKILPAMQKMFASLKQQEQAYTYRGIQGFRNYMQDILDVGEDAYFIGAKAGWYDPRLEPFRERFYKEFNKMKLTGYHIFDWEMKEDIRKKGASPVKVHKKQARFLPKEFSTPSAIDIFGDRVVTFTGLRPYKVDDDLVQFVLISNKLADSYKKWFWALWEMCEEL